MRYRDRCSEIKRGCLTRISQFRVLLDSIERRVKDDNGSINDLGEIQGFSSILDCRLASLAVVRRLRDERLNSAEETS